MVRVADFIADYLYKCGITDIFMISGGGAIHLDNAIANHPGIHEVCVKNEATGPMMAKAYAQVKNNFGVVYVTTGPGGANAITGVVECFVDSSPVLVISGQAPLAQTTHKADIKGLRSFGVQELDIVNVVKPITKYASMVEHAEDILYKLQKAIAIMKSGRPGPVWLDVPLDIQTALVDETTLRTYVHPEITYDSPRRLVESFVKLLNDAERPLIVAGQGIRTSNAAEELKEVARLMDIPIIFSRMGLDTVPFSFEHNMGIGGYRGTRYNKLIMQEADLVLSVGTSLSVAFAGHELSFFNKDAEVVMVDIERAEAMKVWNRITEFIQCDAKVFFGWLKHILIETKYQPKRNGWMEHCLTYKEKWNAKILAPKRNPIDIYYLVKMVDDMSTENDIFVNDAGSIYYVASQTLTFDKGQREITSGAYASMGNAIPLAIGSAIANRDMRILAMTGDGSLETNVQELKTLSYYNLNVKLFVINNGGYISMRDHGRNTDAESNAMLNLKKVADAYDMPYYRIGEYADFEWVKNIINKKGPAFFEVVCDDNQKLISPL